MAHDQNTTRGPVYLSRRNILKNVEALFDFFELGDMHELGNAIIRLADELRSHEEYIELHKDKRKRRKKAVKFAKQTGQPTHRRKQAAPRTNQTPLIRRSHPGLDKLAQDAGYPCYDAYLKSPEWANYHRRYAQAWPDCKCVACGWPDYNLHHITYDRLGRENLSDTLPLCKECHDKLHRAHKKDKIPTWNLKAGLTAAFNWSPSEIAKRLEPYYRLHG